MSSPSKIKGSQWERESARLLEDKISGSVWKRVPGSGAIGTIMNEPLLSADVRGVVPGFTPEIRAEAKVGYGGAKQFAIKREWLTKIREEAGLTNSLPILLGKFSGARGASRTFVVLDTEAFAFLMNYISKMSEEIELLLDKQEIESTLNVKEFEAFI